MFGLDLRDFVDEKGNLTEEGQKKLLEAFKSVNLDNVFTRPNISPPLEWKEHRGILPHMRTFFYKDEDIKVQVSCETYTDETWLRISCSKLRQKLDDEFLDLIIKDFLGEQWVEPNKRTFIFKPENRNIAMSGATMILFCLSGRPSESGFVFRTIRKGLI